MTFLEECRARQSSSLTPNTHHWKYRKTWPTWNDNQPVREGRPRLSPETDKCRPGRETNTRPKGKRTPGCLWRPPAERQWGSAPPLPGTAAPWLCECPNPTAVPATAGWERRGAVPPEAYHCNAAANGQAAAPRYHRDLHENGKSINGQHAFQLNSQIASEELRGPSGDRANYKNSSPSLTQDWDGDPGVAAGEPVLPKLQRWWRLSLMNNPADANI